MIGENLNVHAPSVYEGVTKNMGEKSWRRIRKTPQKERKEIGKERTIHSGNVKGFAAKKDRKYKRPGR